MTGTDEQELHFIHVGRPTRWTLSKRPLPVSRCKLGFFNLDPNNPQGCTPCFCFQHSSVCDSAEGYSVHTVSSTFSRGNLSPAPSLAPDPSAVACIQF